MTAIIGTYGTYENPSRKSRKELKEEIRQLRKMLDELEAKFDGVNFRCGLALDALAGIDAYIDEARARVIGGGPIS